MRITIAALAVSLVVSGAYAADPPKCPAWWTYGSGVAEWPTRARACASRMGQSPIDVPANTTVAAERLSVHYRPITRKVLNTSRTGQIDVGGQENWVGYGGVQYFLKEIHFHTPSEHTHGDGKHDAMEAHLLHVAANGGILVVAVLFDKGTSSDALHAIISAIPKACDASQHDVTFSPLALVPWKGVDATRWTTYVGSKTTPDCDPNVRFVIMDQRMYVSDADRDHFHAIFGDNIRPTQPLGGRHVEVHPVK